MKHLIYLNHITSISYDDNWCDMTLINGKELSFCRYDNFGEVDDDVCYRDVTIVMDGNVGIPLKEFLNK